MDWDRVQVSQIVSLPLWKSVEDAIIDYSGNLWRFSGTR